MITMLALTIAVILISDVLTLGLLIAMIMMIPLMITVTKLSDVYTDLLLTVK